jgi:hypothetical protein
VRTRLLERGVKLDLHSISDSLWNIKSQQKERFASYNRVRGTVDIDLGTLVSQQGWSFHATAVWQTGANMGSYLGLDRQSQRDCQHEYISPGFLVVREDLVEESYRARVGQFAGQDSYGDQNFGKSFVFGPISGSLDNLSNTFESFDPPSTPALEIRVVPFHNFYVKSMVLAVDRSPFSNNSNWPGSTVPWNSCECFGNWVHSRQEGVVHRFPLTTWQAERDTRDSISSAPLTIPGSSLCRQVRQHGRATTSCIGSRVRLCGARTQKKRRVWMRRYHTTGALEASIGLYDAHGGAALQRAAAH